MRLQLFLQTGCPDGVFSWITIGPVNRSPRWGSLGCANLFCKQFVPAGLFIGLNILSAGSFLLRGSPVRTTCL
jgi:hypothetical protein